MVRKVKQWNSNKDAAGRLAMMRKEIETIKSKKRRLIIAL